MDHIKEAHVFIQGGGNQALGREIVGALHPEYLSQTAPPQIVVHDVFGHWPGEMFAYAYADLRKNHNIMLSSTNCLLQDGSAYGKNIYVVYLKA